jgi:hypothetical protein
LIANSTAGSCMDDSHRARTNPLLVAPSCVRMTRAQCRPDPIQRPCGAIAQSQQREVNS